jgi:hypothetical protein
MNKNMPTSELNETTASDWASWAENLTDDEISQAKKVSFIDYLKTRAALLEKQAENTKAELARFTKMHA